MRTSNRAADGKPLLSAEHLEQLRHLLSVIHGKFARIYGKSSETEHFSMEIEFKITRKGKLAVKSKPDRGSTCNPNQHKTKEEEP